MNDMAHSNWGGSVCKRYRSCPGSVAFCATVPPIPAGPAAEEGTLAHAFAEHFLREGTRSCIEHIGMTLEPTLNSPVLTKEMARAIQHYLDAVWEEVDAAPDAEYYVEQRFVLPVSTAPEGAVFGRNDCLVYSKSRKKLTVFDYKHGYQPVQAEDNDQGKFYAAGAAFAPDARDWALKDVEIVIVQPNARDADYAGAVRRWAWSPVDLLEFMGELEVDIEKTLQPNAPLIAGDHCMWCDAAPHCTARIEAALKDAQLDFKDVTLVTPKDLPEVKSIDTDRLAKFVKVAKVFAEWGKQIEDHIFGLLEQGHRVAGYKLVEKQARRKWQSSGDEVAGYLATMYGIDFNEVMPPTLCTITEAEALLTDRIRDRVALKAAKDDLSLRFTVKESSGLTIAPDHDKRDAVVKDPAKAFQAVAL